MKVHPLALLALLPLCACLSTEVETVACSDDAGCPLGSRCEEGTCRPDPSAAPPLAAEECPGPPVGTHPNLLPDPGFECYGEPWRWLTAQALVSVETAQVHSGEQALRLEASSSGTSAEAPPTLTSRVPFQVQRGGTYCASAWVRGRTETVELRLLRRQGSGGAQVSTALFPNENDWTPLPTPHADAASRGLALQALPGDALTVEVALTAPRQGDFLLVDDLALWQAPAGGGCGD